MALQPDDFSRFIGTDTVLFKEEEIWGAWSPPTFMLDVKDDDYKYFQVDKRHEGRPDLIADTEYGNSLLDWVIIAYNGAKEVLNWPRVGDVIKIPKGSLVSRELF